MLLLPFWGDLWPTFGRIFSDQIGSHMVRQNVESFQAWSFLLDWPVWPQNAVSHLAKSWGFPPRIFEETNLGSILSNFRSWGNTPKSSERRFVFEIRGPMQPFKTELFCLYLSTVAMLISNSNWVIFGFWTLFWWFWREGLFAQIGALYGTRMYWFRVPNKWH